MNPEPTIIDAHHHIWRLDRTPWLSGPPVPRIFGDYEPLRRDYTIDEYASDAKPHGVVKSVYVQINVAEGDEVAEVEQASAAGRRHDLIQAVVSFADLADPSVGDVLDRQLAAGPVRGVRQQLHWHENPAFRFAAEPDAMLRPEWLHGLREVAARGLHFELQVFPGQFPSAIRLVELAADTKFVLLHAGMLHDRSPEGFAAWHAGLVELASHPNVLVKLSALGTFDRACRADRWKPVIERAVDAFGPERSMFGSNFPIEKLWTSYEELISVFSQCLAGYSPAERARIMQGTAAELYRI